MTPDCYLLSFRSAHDAMKAQTILDGKLAYLVVPTPRSLSGSCGISLKIAAQCEDALMKLLRSGTLDVCGPRCWTVEGSGPFAEYEEMKLDAD